MTFLGYSWVIPGVEGPPTQGSTNSTVLSLGSGFKPRKCHQNCHKCHKTVVIPPVTHSTSLWLPGPAQYFDQNRQKR